MSWFLTIGRFGATTVWVPLFLLLAWIIVSAGQQGRFRRRVTRQLDLSNARRKGMPRRKLLKMRSISQRRLSKDIHCAGAATGALFSVLTGSLVASSIAYLLQKRMGRFAHPWPASNRSGED
jgi:hypothetical protein